MLVYEKLEDILKETTLDQVSNLIKMIYLGNYKSTKFYLKTQMLFTFDLKPIASQIASKLVEYDDKTITKSFNQLNSNELEFICTSNVGSHFVQHCLKTFSSKDKIEWLQSFLDKLKVIK